MGLCGRCRTGRRSTIPKLKAPDQILGPKNPGADSPKRLRGALALDVAARWREAGPSGLVFLSASETQAEYLGANIHSLFPDCPVMVLPRWNSLPYDPAGPSRDIMGRRASVLRRLASGLATGLEPPLLIATPEAVLQRVPPRELWKDAALRVAPGTAVVEIEAFLRRTGYGLDMLIDERARRPCICMSSTSSRPARSARCASSTRTAGSPASTATTRQASAPWTNCRKSCSTRPPNS